MLGVFVMRPASAPAAEPAPVRIVAVQTDADDSSSLRDTLAEALDRRDDIELVSSATLLDESDELGIDKEDYRKGSRREDLVDDFAKVLDRAGADAMFLVDMISGGDRVQLVVIGPGGAERADIRAARAEAASDVESVLIEPALEALPAELFEAQQQVDSEAPDDTSGQDDESNERAAARQEGEDEASSPEKPPSAGAQPPPARAAFELNAGAFFGRRSFSASSSVDYALTTVVPLVGARIALGARLAQWANRRSRLRIAANGAWAPYSVQFGAFNQTFDEKGTHISGRLELVYLQALSRALSARVAAGGDAISDTVEPNPVFTGSRYTNARLTVGTIIHPDDVIELMLSGGVMPIITAETSGDSYGDSNAGLGYTAHASLMLSLADNLQLNAQYDLRVYSTTFPEPKVIDASIQTNEVFHSGIFGLTYGF